MKLVYLNFILFFKASTADEDDENEIDSDDDISESEMTEEPYSNEISELEHKDEFDLSSLLEDSEKKSINSNQQVINFFIAIKIITLKNIIMLLKAIIA